MAAFIVWLIMFHKDKSVIIVANTKDVAKNMLIKVKTVLNNLPSWMYLAEQEENNVHTISFSNGSSVQSIARSDNAGRSHAVSLLVLDEAAHIDRMDELWKGAASTVATGGKVVALSCVTKDTFVFTDKGIQQVSDFVPNGGSPGDYEIEEYSILGEGKQRKSCLFHNNGKVKTLKIKTKLSELEGSENHKLWACKEGKYDWYRLDQLSVGDWVNVKYGMNCWGDDDDVSDFIPEITSNHKNIFKPDKITPDIAYVLGLYLAEGNGSDKYGYIDFTCGDEIRESLSSLGLPILSYDEGLHNRISSRTLVDFFQYLGFDLENKAHQKEIPSRLMRMSKGNIAAMLSGMFDGDGSSHGTRGSVSLCLSTEKMIDQVRILLLNFGIRSYKQKRTVDQLNENLPESWYPFKHDSYRLELNGINSSKFYSEIGFRLNRKQFNEEILLSKKDVNTHDVVPYSLDLMNVMFEYFPKGTWTLAKNHELNINGILNKKTRYKTEHISSDNVHKMYSVCEEYLPDQLKEKISKILLPESEWVEINSIEEGCSETFDFSLPDNKYDFWDHSVIYNGILGHQTPKGIGNWFHEYFTKAVSGEIDWHPFITHWWENPDYASDLEEDENTPGGKTSSWFRKTTEGWSRQQIAQELLTSFVESGDNYFDVETMEYYEKTSLDPISKEGPDRNLWIWKRPISNYRYLISADVCHGNGEDYASAHVFELKDMEIVAEYKGKMPPDMFGDFLVDLGERYNNAYICPENQGVGLACCLHIKNLGYRNLCYFSKENLRLIDQWSAEYHGIAPGQPMNLKERTMILAKAEEYLRKKLVKSYSKRLAYEMQTFVIHNSKPQAQKGTNDDVVMSVAIGIWVRDMCPEFRSSLASADAVAVINAITKDKREYNTTNSRDFRLQQHKKRIQKLVEDQKMPLSRGQQAYSWIYKV